MSFRDAYAAIKAALGTQVDLGMTGDPEGFTTFGGGIITFGEGMKVAPICVSDTVFNTDTEAVESARNEIDAWIAAAKAAGLKNWAIRHPYELCSWDDYDKGFRQFKVKFRAVAF